MKKIFFDDEIKIQIQAFAETDKWCAEKCRLKFCPFCSGPPAPTVHFSSWTSAEDSNKTFYLDAAIHCQWCRASSERLSMNGFRGSWKALKAQVVRAWNTRASGSVDG